MTPKHDARGCVVGYDCHNPANDGGPAPSTCTSVGGSCKGISPGNCENWGDATMYSCGGGVGVGCCFPACPEIQQPGPGFCTDGNIVTHTNAAGCTSYDCDRDGGVSNPCIAGGGQCVGLAPGSCSGPGQSWSGLSCGPSVGVGCCL